MTAYIANHEKKNRLFAKRERELLHAIKHEFSNARLEAAAERLRAAKLAVFKCRFTMNSVRQPHAFSPQQLATCDQRIRLWLAMSTEEIINRYRGGTDAGEKELRVAAASFTFLIP